MTGFLFFSVEAAGRLALLRHSSSQDAKMSTLPLYWGERLKWIWIWIFENVASSFSILSEQQLVDCDTTNYGCNGGWYVAAWTHLQQRSGSVKRTLYPYTARVIMGISISLSQRALHFPCLILFHRFEHFLYFLERDLQIKYFRNRSPSVHVQLRGDSKCPGHARCPAEIRSNCSCHDGRQLLLLLWVICLFRLEMDFPSWFII